MGVVHAAVCRPQWRIQDFIKDANFCWTLVLTQRGTNHVFLFILMGEKNLLPRGHGPIPLNTPLIEPVFLVKESAAKQGKCMNGHSFIHRRMHKEWVHNSISSLIIN